MAATVRVDDRLDRALPELALAASRGEARRLIADGRVFVDGRCARSASRSSATAPVEDPRRRA